ncbi:MAG: GNAT family N-acetyltransferase [Anaerolineales bacterium]|nr:GNAT family N-acetyltransferase [Anaerolineales bacterium]
MTQASKYSLTQEAEPAEADLETIRAGLHAFNTLAASDDGHRTLTLFLRDENGTLLGGLLGDTYWGWLHVAILWLEEKARRRGHGSRLLGAAEAEAIRRGCHHAHLDTMSFQALPFYQKHGYEVWGEIHDMPVGHSRIFLSKRLDGGR